MPAKRAKRSGQSSQTDIAERATSQTGKAERAIQPNGHSGAGKTQIIL